MELKYIGLTFWVFDHCSCKSLKSVHAILTLPLSIYNYIGEPIRMETPVGKPSRPKYLSISTPPTLILVVSNEP